MKQKLEKNGYLMISIIGDDGKSKTFSVHSLVCAAWNGPRPEGFVTRHLDGDAMNNRAKNLCWGTPKQNAADRVMHGTLACGERFYAAKITEQDVVTIRNSRACDQDLADKYNLSKSHVNAIRNGRKWKHVKLEATV